MSSEHIIPGVSPRITKKSVHFSLEALAEHFHKPINEVSAELGVCATALKKACRRVGLVRWPYRKISAIDSRITLLKALVSSGTAPPSVEVELRSMEAKRAMIMKNPGLSVKLGAVPAAAAAAAAARGMSIHPPTTQPSLSPKSSPKLSANPPPPSFTKFATVDSPNLSSGDGINLLLEAAEGSPVSSPIKQEIVQETLPAVEAMEEVVEDAEDVQGDVHEQDQEEPVQELVQHHPAPAVSPEGPHTQEQEVQEQEEQAPQSPPAVVSSSPQQEAVVAAAASASLAAISAPVMAQQGSARVGLLQPVTVTELLNRLAGKPAGDVVLVGKDWWTNNERN